MIKLKLKVQYIPPLWCCQISAGVITFTKTLLATENSSDAGHKFGKNATKWSISTISLECICGILTCPITTLNARECCFTTMEKWCPRQTGCISSLDISCTCVTAEPIHMRLLKWDPLYTRVHGIIAYQACERQMCTSARRQLFASSSA